MRVVLKQDIYQINGGVAARSPELKIVAHGSSAEIAAENLRAVALAFLKPFQRQGTLERELQLLGINTEDDGAGLTVVMQSGKERG